MNTVNGLLISVLFFIFVTPSASKATQGGGGYSRQIIGNTGLEQYEMFVREPLPYHTILGNAFQISSFVEIGMAVIRETHVEHSEIGRFSIMPQLVLKPHNRIQYFFGLGTGFMGGKTEFTRHDLGGEFFLASKSGIRFLFGEGWGVECVYYHQSNAGIYNHNASLNMQQLAVFYTF